jgi:hypothetical protein
LEKLLNSSIILFSKIKKLLLTMCQSTEDDMSNALMEAKPDFKYTNKILGPYLSDKIKTNVNL